MINIRGGELTLAALLRAPVPRDSLDARIHRTRVEAWERVAPIVLADMQRMGAL